MIKYIKIIPLVIIFCFALSYQLSSVTLAQSIFTEYLDRLPGYQTDINWLFGILRSTACYLFQFAVIALGVMIIVYGILMLKGAGNSQTVSKVKTALTWGVVGGLVIFGVITIILTVSTFLGVTENPILNALSCG